MKYTNKFNLPDPIHNTLIHDNYGGYEHKKNHFCSVTELLSPAYQLSLKEKYRDQIEIDSSGRLWLVLGNAVHAYCENVLTDLSQVMTEERVTINIADRMISGGVDLYDGNTKTIYDFKVTSIWTLKFLDENDPHGRFQEWTKQLNLYKIGYQQAGFEVNNIKIIAIMRDWVQREAKRHSDYFQCPIKVVNIPIMDLNRLKDFVHNQSLEIEKARKGELDVCSPAERWEKPTTYAIKKINQKRAVKANIQTRHEANVLLDKYGANHFVEERKGESVRCLDYCDVCRFCPHWTLNCQNTENE